MASAAASALKVPLNLSGQIRIFISNGRADRSAAFRLQKRWCVMDAWPNSNAPCISTILQPKGRAPFATFRFELSEVCGMLIADFLTMNKPKIVAYLKPTCGWSQGVRAIMRKYDLPYEDRDIINDPLQRQEMIEKSGQMLSPCVEINGRMLADISGEEVETYLLANGLVGQTERAA